MGPSTHSLCPTSPTIVDYRLNEKWPPSHNTVAVLIAQAEPGITRERDAIEAMKLGARRMDFIGMKFQFADEVAMYDRARDTTSKAPGRTWRTSPG